MNGRVVSRPVLIVGLTAMIAASASVALAEPRVTLKVPPFTAAVFENFASVMLPKDGYGTVEILLENALGEIRMSTVRVTLNEMPMALFVSVNPMPAGVRAIVKLGMTMNPDYAIHRQGESILTFAATDVSGTAYRGQFYLSIDEAKQQPELAKTTRARLQEGSLVAPPQHRPPVVEITSTWPARTVERILMLECAVSDPEGLRRVVIELNAKDIEEIALQNERPVRYQNGRIVRATTAGQVDGNGTKLRVSIPIRLQTGRINVVAVRAENLVGLGVRADRSVEVLGK